MNLLELETQASRVGLVQVYVPVQLRMPSQRFGEMNELVGVVSAEEPHADDGFDDGCSPQAMVAKIFPGGGRCLKGHRVEGERLVSDPRIGESSGGSLLGAIDCKLR